MTREVKPVQGIERDRLMEERELLLSNEEESLSSYFDGESEAAPLQPAQSQRRTSPQPVPVPQPPATQPVQYPAFSSPPPISPEADTHIHTHTQSQQSTRTLLTNIAARLSAERLAPVGYPGANAHRPHAHTIATAPAHPNVHSNVMQRTNSASGSMTSTVPYTSTRTQHIVAQESAQNMQNVQNVHSTHTQSTAVSVSTDTVPTVVPVSVSGAVDQDASQQLIEELLAENTRLKELVNQMAAELSRRAGPPPTGAHVANSGTNTNASMNMNADMNTYHIQRSTGAVENKVVVCGHCQQRLQVPAAAQLVHCPLCSQVTTATTENTLPANQNAAGGGRGLFGFLSCLAPGSAPTQTQTQR